MLRFQTEIEFLSGQVDYIKRVFFPLRKDASTLNSLDLKIREILLLIGERFVKVVRLDSRSFYSVGRKIIEERAKHLNVNKRWDL